MECLDCPSLSEDNKGDTICDCGWRGLCGRGYAPLTTGYVTCRHGHRMNVVDYSIFWNDVLGSKN